MAFRPFAISALLLGGMLLPDATASTSHASCITFRDGRSVCDAPRQRMNYAPPPAQRGGGGYRYRSGGGGGGGGNYAAAVGAAGAAIGILGMMIDAAQQAEQSERNSADAATRQRHARCQSKYRTAYATNERARRLSESGRPEEAYELFQQAKNTLGSCGTRTDTEKLRGNLESAQWQYASLVNPSAKWTGDDTNVPKNGPLPPAVSDLAARKLCSFAKEESPAWQSCIANRKAEAIMSGDKAIRDACQAIADIEQRNQCAYNRYWAGVQGKDPNQFGDPSNCYWDEHGKPCHRGGGARGVASQGPAPGRSTLREELQKKINNMPDRIPDPAQKQRDAEIARAEAVRDSLPPGPDRDRLTAAIDDAKAGRTGPAADAPVAGADANPPPAKVAETNAPPDKSLDQQAYDEYMKGRDGKLDGGVNVGVPENGSFANDFGGDKLLDSSIPSNR